MIGHSHFPFQIDPEETPLVIHQLTQVFASLFYNPSNG